MKKLFCTFTLILICTSGMFAQLGGVVITSAPCDCNMGASSVITASVSPGATYYEWSVASGQNNAVWLNGIPGPVQTAAPSVYVSCQLFLQSVTICVRAHNATDSSNAACVTLVNTVAIPVLSGSNSPVGIPGDSGMYSVDSPTPCPPAQYIWTLTGDALFNNNSQTAYTANFQIPVNVNFGPAFTSGTLCVQAVSGMGLLSDTVCMTISAPVGINDISHSHLSFYYQPALQQVALIFSKPGIQEIAVRIYDLTGRLVLPGNPTSNRIQDQLFVSTQGLKQGIYFVEVTGIDFRKIFKFAKAK